MYIGIIPLAYASVGNQIYSRLGNIKLLNKATHIDKLIRIVIGSIVAGFHTIFCTNSLFYMFHYHQDKLILFFYYYSKNICKND